MPPEPSAAPALQGRGRWPRRLLLLGLLAALGGGLIWTGWYVYYRGFSKRWRAQLTAELRRRGFDFTARRLTLDPFAGLVAEEANLYLLDERHTRLLYMKRVSVDLSLWRLIRQKPFLNSLDLRGARVRLPVDLSDPKGPVLKLRRFSGRLSLLPGEIRLTQAQGDFYGLQIFASGRLRNPEAFNPAGPPADADERARRRQWARAVTDEIQKVRSDRAAPGLEIRFDGDLAHPEEMRASAELQGDALRRGHYLLRKLLVRADYAAGAFHLRQAELTDTHGALTGQGDFNPATGDTRFQLQSGLDLLALAREFYGPLPPGMLGDLSLRDTPRLSLEGRTRFGPPPDADTRRPAAAPLPPALPVALPAAPRPLQFTGHLALGRFAYRGFEFERGETDFTWKEDRWYLRGLRVARPGGGGEQLTADVLSEPGQARVRLTSTLDPLAFVPLLPPRFREAVARLEFRDPPRLELTATGRSLADPAALRVEGQFTLGRTRYRGQGLNRLHGEFTFGDGLLAARHVTLERDEGSATGEQVVYDQTKHEIRLENVRTSLDPATAGVWLDPDVYHSFLPYHFRKPPLLAIHGTVQLEGGRNSHLVTEVSAPGGMDFVFLHKNLPFQSVAGEIVFNEERLRLNDLRGQIFGGQVHGALDLTLGRVKDYKASVEVADLDFVTLTKLYFGYDDSKGALSGAYRWTGRSDDERTLRGVGHLNVDRGNVFAIPFLGPLSTLLSAVLPGLGFDQAHRATADFLTRDGKIITGNLDVHGVGFSLFGGGWLGYADDTMNFRVKMNTRGLPGTLLSPVSWLFEYGSQGPFHKPVWRPRVLAAPVARKPAGPAPPVRIGGH